jgi:hypothetical protein
LFDADHLMLAGDLRGRSLLPDANFAPAAAGEHHRIAFTLRDLS